MVSRLQALHEEGAMSPARLVGWLAITLLAGCQRMTLEGTVTGPTGDPLPDARVAVVGALCHGKTDAEGHFSLPCTPGDLHVAVMQEGYVSKSLSVQATEKRAYPLGDIALLPIPDSPGLYVLHGATWKTPAPVLLERRNDLHADPPRRSTCLLPSEAGGTPVTDEVVLYARDAGDLEVFRLDNEGCARHLKRQGRGWVTVDTVRPQRDEETVAQGQRVIRLTLKPGRYVVAPWSTGAFTKDDKASRQAGAERLSAYLLVDGGSPDEPAPLEGH